MAEINVVLRDGQSVPISNVPDNIPREELKAKLQARFGDQISHVEGLVRKGDVYTAAGAQVKEAEQAERGAGVLKKAGSALAQGALDIGDLLYSGVAGMAQIPTELALGAMGRKDKLDIEGEVLRGREAADQLANLRQAIDVPAQTTGEQYAKSIMQAIGGSVGPGMAKAPLTALTSATGAGAGSEAAAQLMSDNPLSRILGSVVGGLTAGGMANAAGRRINPNAEELAREGLEGISPEDLAQAQATMKQVKDRFGIELDLSQALSDPRNMTKIRDVLANTKYGDEVQRILRDQPGQVRGVLRSEVGQLPGEVLPSKQQAADSAQEAATEFLSRIRGDIQREVDPIYKAAGALPGTRQALTSTIDQFLSEPKYSDIRRDLMAFKAKLNSAPWTRTKENPKGRPAETIEEFDQLFKEFTGPYKAPTLSGRTADAAQFKQVAGELRRVLYEASEGTAEGAKRYRELQSELLEPMKKGPVGRLAGPRGALPDKEATTSTLWNIFDAGTDPNVPKGKSEITQVAKMFKAINPEGFNNAAKTWLSGKIENAVRYTEDGTIAPESIENIRKTLYDSPVQRQGLRNVLAGMAENSDLPPERVVRSFEGFMNVLAKTAKRPPTVGGLSLQQVSQLAGKSKMADVVRFWGITANMTAGRRIEEQVLGKTLQQLDKLLTTPEGVDYLMELAKTGYVSPKAVIKGTTALATIQQATENEE